MSASPPVTVAQLLAGYRDGSLAVADVVARAHQRALAATQPAWISIVPWETLAARIEELCDVSPEAPLYGIPFAVKDNIDVAGLPTTVACRTLRRRPTADAYVVARLLAAGAVVIGKTNMDQFATGLTGTRSPYGACHAIDDPRSISGGSSSGSAIAVADGTVPFALATDTAGSGRVPAALNGLVGLKPSRGRLSTSGTVPACRTLDCVSVLATDVAGAAHVTRVAAGADPADPFSRPPVAARPARATPVVGVPDAVLSFGDDGLSRGAWQAALARARDLGWTLVPIDIAPFLRAGRLLYAGPWVAERAAVIEPYLARDPGAIDPSVAQIVSWAGNHSAGEVFAGLYELAEIARTVEGPLEEVDALLLPTAPTTFTHAEVAGDPIGRNAELGLYTTFANLLDMAAVAVPAGRRPDGLPFGVSLLGPRGSDERLVDLAARWTGETCPAPADPALLPLAVVGAHLSGEPLNHQLVDGGARLLETTRTSPAYRLYELPGDGPAKPGLVRTAGDAGAGIEVELWAISPEALGRLMVQIPSPLGIGTVALADGRAVKGFLCEPVAVAGAMEITAFGGWRAYRAAGV